MNTKKKILISLLIMAVLVAIYLLSLAFGNQKYDIEERLKECGLSSENGQVISVTQSTVSNAANFRVGLKSVMNGQANLQIWNPLTNTTSPTLSLRQCESSEFEGKKIYLLNIYSAFNLPFPSNRTGNAHNYVDLLIK